MLLHICSKPTLVISRPDAAHEIMKNHDVIFSSRPASSFSRKLLYNHKNVAFAPYGDYWKQVREICVLLLLTTKRFQSFQPVREEETKAMIEIIKKSCSSSPSFFALVDLREVLMSLSNDVTCRINLGKKYGREDSVGKKFRKMIAELSYLVGVFNVGEFIPWLAWVNYVVGLEQKVEKSFQEVDSFLDQIIKDHILKRKIKDYGDHAADGVGQDFVDFLLRLQEDKSAKNTIGRENIKTIVLVSNTS
ncbi:hypothetical protein NE237_014908 [Protea cynaroides]|uniref:Uncharacterized protein n=1 Tax=Protea cynaroides TaxID=273540 RepID=A0A9Q0KCZ7_9MAGN|nr:hypothetical protein NE237_014908 [Protea cynaroides]